MGILFLAGLFVGLSHSTFAATLDGQTNTEDFSEIQAPNFGCRSQYSSFMGSVRSKNLKNLGIKEIFTLSSCRLNDLVALDDEIDELREDLKAASLSCSPSDDLETEYLKLKLEVYYVRNLLKVDVSALTEKERTEILENPEDQFSLLEAQMKEIFVNQEGRISELLLNQYFAEWRLKYEDRLPDYVDCQSGDFGAITKSWNSLLTTLQNLSKKTEKKSDPTQVEEEKKSEDEGEKPKQEFQPLVDPYATYKSKLENAVSQEITPQKTIDDLAAQGGQSLENIFDDFREEDLRFSLEYNAQARLQRYAILYGNGGGAAGDALQTVVADLNAVLEDSNTTSLPQILQMSNKVFEKQCE